MPLKSSLSPAVILFLRVMAAVFLAEGFVMLILYWLPPMGEWLEALLDSTLLTLLVTPLLWRWLGLSDRQRRLAEAELQKSNESQQKTNVMLEKNRVVQPDGAVRWVLDSGTPIRDAGGVVVSVGGVARDITERKDAEEQMLRAQRLENIGMLGVCRT